MRIITLLFAFVIYVNLYFFCSVNFKLSVQRDRMFRVINLFIYIDSVNSVMCKVEHYVLARRILRLAKLYKVAISTLRVNFSID